MTTWGGVSSLVLLTLGCGGSGEHDSSATGGARAAGIAGAAGKAGASTGGVGNAGDTSSAGASHAGAGGSPTHGGAGNNSGTGGAASGGVGGFPDTEGTAGCAKWIVDDVATRPVTVTSGADGLVIAYPAGGSSSPAKFGDYSLEQRGLAGDFDITVSWKNFVPGDVKPANGPKFQAGIFWLSPAGDVYSAVSRVGGGTAEAAIVHDTQFTKNALSPLEMPAWYEGASGSFRFQRANAMITVTSTVNGKAVTAMSTQPFPEEPLDLVLWFTADTNAIASTKPSGVTISGVEVTGGGGSVKPDNFSCP